MRGKASSKNFAFLEKLLIYYLRLYSSKPFEGGLGQMYTNLLGSSGNFVIKYLLLNFNKVPFSSQNVCTHSLIGIAVRKTPHKLKCKEKFGLKLKLGNREKTKVFF